MALAPRIGLARVRAANTEQVKQKLKLNYFKKRGTYYATDLLNTSNERQNVGVDSSGDHSYRPSDCSDGRSDRGWHRDASPVTSGQSQGQPTRRRGRYVQDQGGGVRGGGGRKDKDENEFQPITVSCYVWLRCMPFCRRSSAA